MPVLLQRHADYQRQLTDQLARSLSYNAAARLVAKEPAARYGLSQKGNIEIGFDADFCVVDDNASYTVRAEDSLSTQEYTPFEGFELSARVTDTFLRGSQVLADGNVVGTPQGEYLRRSGN